MAERIFRDRDIKHIWAVVIDEKPDGWCKVVFMPKGTNVFNYHIEYLKFFYEEKTQEQEMVTSD